MSETEDQLWATVNSAARANTRHRVKLTDKCRSLLVGDQVRRAGDVVELAAERARELCASGCAVPISPGWFTATPKKPTPEADSSRQFDEPGYGRDFKVSVCKGRSIYNGVGRSYGDGSIIYLSESDARCHLKAGNIKLIDPPGLPADDPAKRADVKTNRLGVSPLLGVDPHAARAGE
jgi:hypothetical protein